MPPGVLERVTETSVDSSVVRSLSFARIPSHPDAGPADRRLDRRAERAVSGGAASVRASTARNSVAAGGRNGDGGGAHGLRWRRFRNSAIGPLRREWQVSASQNSSREKDASMAYKGPSEAGVPAAIGWSRPGCRAGAGRFGARIVDARRETRGRSNSSRARVGRGPTRDRGP